MSRAPAQGLALLTRCIQSIEPRLSNQFAIVTRSLTTISNPSSSSVTDSSALNQQVCLSGSRGVVQVLGPGSLEFLQGLVTNDVRLLQQGGRLLYAAILSPKGKFLHDLFIHHPTAGNDATENCLLDVDASGCADLIRLLARYKLRKPFQIADVSDRYHVWQEFGPSSTSSTGWPADPRLPQLGWRTILPADSTPTTSGASTAGSDDAEAFKRWRVELGVAEGDVEMPSGKASPLEFNLDALNGISFHKGCYVGQERQSYTHYRGVIRRRLMPLRLHRATGVGIEPDMEVAIIPESGTGWGEPLGTLRAVSGGIGLGHLRLAPAMDPRVRLGVLGKEGVEVRPFVPVFWPPDFTLLDAAGGEVGLDMAAGEKS